MPSRHSSKLPSRVRLSQTTRVSVAKKKPLSKTLLSKKTALKGHVSVVDVVAGQLESSPLRRDFNLLRAILIETEQPGIHTFSFNGYDPGMVQAHLILLIEAGFLRGSIMREGNGATHALVDRLTWTGHDLLALIKDNTRWQKARTTMLDANGRADFDVLASWLKSH